MADTHYISDPVLYNLIECTTHSYRDGVLYLDLDADTFMVDVNMNAEEKLHCAVWGASVQFDLTEDQLNRIGVKVKHLLQDELEKIEESGESILN